MNLRILILTISTICLITTPQAHSGLTLQFSTDGGTTFSNATSVQVGSTISVDVFLSEDSQSSELQTEGLLGFGLEATNSTAAFAEISSAVIDSVFDAVFQSSSNTSSVQWDAATFAPPPMTSSIKLGTVQVDGVAEGTTTMTVADLTPGSGSSTANWVTAQGSILDEMIFGVGACNTYALTIETTAIPEPGSSECILLVLCIWGGFRRWMSWKIKE